MCFKQYFFSHWQLVLTTKVHLDDLRSASSGAMIWSVVCSGFYPAIRFVDLLSNDLGSDFLYQGLEGLFACD